MGFYGKPSRGCDECRARKIRCDQTKPFCRQCAQSKLKCPGYRDLLTVVFRDQSEEVIQKATRRTQWTRKQSKARIATVPSSSGSSSTPSPSQEETPPRDEKSSPSQAVMDLGQVSLMIELSGDQGQDEAICFFLNNFSWQCSSAHFNDWQRDDSVAAKALVAAVTSVGLGNMSAIRASAAMRRKARNNYATALQFVNQALSDKVVATADQTFSAIILLSLFESITYNDLGSKNKWITHVDGCTSLAVLRGVEKLLTIAGVKMFLEWRGGLIVGALQRGTSVPPILLEYSKIITPLRPAYHAYEENAANLTVEVANLRAAILSKELTDTNERLSLAYTLQAKLEAWAATLPSNWSYRSIPLPPNNAKVATLWGGVRPYGGFYHKYPHDLVMLNGWCNYRVGHILVNEIILNCLSEKLKESSRDPDFIDRCRKIRVTMHKLATDVCASVPHLFGLIADRAEQTDKDFGTCIGAYMLLLPLYTAGCVEGPDHPLRQCVIDCFTLIAYSIGIDHALSHINTLDGTPGVCDWVDELDEMKLL